MLHQSPPADLTIFAVTETAAEAFVTDAQDLCLQSFNREGRRAPIALRFLEAGQVSTEAAAYRPILGVLPDHLEGRVSLWMRAAPDDRCVFIPSLDKDLKAAWLRFLENTPSLDCRIITVTRAAALSEHLRDACHLAFAHLPVYADENAQRSVDYAMSLMRDLLSATPTDKLAPRPVSVVRANFDTDDGAATGRTVLRSRGAPLRFTAPFVNAGFSIDSRIVRETADGALVTNAAKGTALYGPYLQVAGGRYAALLQIRGEEEKAGRLMNFVRGRPTGSLAFDAYLSATDSVLEVVRVNAAMIGPDPIQLELSFTVPELAERPKLELRLHQQSNKSCVVEFIELTWLEG